MQKYAFLAKNGKIFTILIFFCVQKYTDSNFFPYLC